MRKRAAALLAVLSVLAVGCVSWPWREAPLVRVVGMEPLPGEGMEIRFRLELRVQNRDAAPVEYDGLALNLDLNGRPFARGVSDASGSIAGSGEAVIAVPRLDLGIRGAPTAPRAGWRRRGRSRPFPTS
jgi:hypothetical protein